MPGLEVGRVAEVIVTAAAGPGKRGSGYLVGPGVVLTAAHVVAGAAGARVRFDADRPGERTHDAEVVFRHPGPDIAVLSVPRAAARETPVARFGRVGEHDAVLSCGAVGFPAFKLRDEEGGGAYRDTEHVRGKCSVLSNRREGTLDVRAPAPKGDWGGMSGAVVFSGGRIVGVVVAHHVQDGGGRLAVSRADRWAEQLTAAELARLEDSLGCSLASERLPDVVPPSGLGRIKAGYEALLRDIAPPRLAGRRDELRELMEFCAGPEPYRWIQGRPWAGKTALVSSFALNPPRGVVPVSFFITSRLAGQADSTAYTEALVHQLAALDGREPSAHASPALRDGERRALLTEAAERVAEDGATLLLVVDGLDEDHSARTPGTPGPSIASLLPERPPPGVRVLVTSRPNPDLPLDVGPGHPLRRCAIKTLSSTGIVMDLEHEARFELSRALAGDDLEKEIVGLLAAARGSLRPEDLRELTGRQLYEVRQRVNGVFGRILRLRGDSARELDERGYLFAHETLFAAAVEMLGPDVGPYRERIHGWADGYRERGWPEETPPYLLRQYGRMVTGLGDVERAARLATDARRQDRMRRVGGSDGAALAEIDAVRTMIERQAPDDLGRLAALGAAEDLVSSRNASLPWNLPVVMARLGRIQRAEGLARSVFSAAGRARALVGVAQAMAEAGDARAAELAEEARELAYTVRNMPAAEVDEMRAEVIRAAAVVLATLGRGAEALEVAETLRETEWDIEYGDGPEDIVSATPSYRMTAEAATACVEVAAAVRPYDARLADDILERVWAAGESLEVYQGRISVLGTVAAAYATVHPPHAAALLDQVEESALDAAGPALWIVASAICRTRPEAAARLALKASSDVKSLLGTEDEEGGRSGVGWVVRALVDCGLTQEAQDLADAYRVADMRACSIIAAGWARAGEVERASRVLRAVHGESEVPSHVRVTAAGELASAGAFDEAERVAATIGSPRLAAEALGAVAGHILGSDTDRAASLLETALETARRPLTDDRWLERQLRALAHALAMVGDFRHAERLARWLADPAEHIEVLATMAMVLSSSDLGAARRLAEAAADELEHEGGRLTADGEHAGPTTHHAARAVSYALARVGLMERRSALLARVRLGGTAEASPTLVAALWELSPELAEDIARVLERQLTESADRDTHLRDGVELLLAVGRRAPQRARSLREALRREIADCDPVSRFFHAESHMAATLLVAWTDPERPLRATEVIGPPARETGGHDGDARALVHAACGEYDQAEALVEGLHYEGEEPEARAAMAATIAGLPWRPWLDRGVLGLTRGCIELVMPRPPADATRLARAREQLRKVLLTEHWDEGLPVLAELDPGAIRPVRDVVFAHLGIEVDEAADAETLSPVPQPPPRPAPA
ncbi:trypsin-like peptidase domain-containing protein [Streptomyces sparsogenes]|uniref:trypsin-like peptidase domain-containing protein n=1 Tax=Streptomyces sparsogenes TaxID=67365 RepID=UPI00332BFFE9